MIPVSINPIYIIISSIDSLHEFFFFLLLGNKNLFVL